ncbi:MULTISPECIES: fibrobacter succinogenes major paralogous domain-containing protein [unclassified Fibrobacter]|uniref:fibrobacter succinogenes major paralogous domain-containing protein n=1 Tax=unclassified Fibrobacter TaxID=2634177 RepID=UPI000D6D8901|nr:MULTISPECIES: fibrobacter succinogenes major paralogous domain-containing protein [unclassified Fibrobacter]PWJ61119.1 uncharacterized protein (TIGR02145 family) [Fibrobacter sp. UWR4]PZW65577.1 uncharacterized protein (TIGR02145 family) [Fibrobacter sp. UWR1]
MKKNRLIGACVASLASILLIACGSGSSSSSADDNVTYGTLTDSRDGQSYKTLTIGGQTWMAENLNYRYVGVKHDCCEGKGMTDSSSWCFNDDAGNCSKYGRLYSWSAAMDSAGLVSSANADAACGNETTCTPNVPHRGVCPEGWHVPTLAEWSSFATVVGGKKCGDTEKCPNVGGILKSTSGWLDEGGFFARYDGYDEIGFTVLPGGVRGINGRYLKEGEQGSFWSTAEIDEGNAYYRYAVNYDSTFIPYSNYKPVGLYIRCVKD